MAQTWSLTWLIRNMVAELLMPPGIFLIGIAIVLIFLKKRIFLKHTLVGILCVMLWLTSTVALSQWLFRVSDPWLSWPPPLNWSELARKNTTADLATPQLASPPVKKSAIVILGGGMRDGAIDLPQYGQQDLSNSTMARLRMGARLAKETALPVLVIGGRPDKTQPQQQAEGQMMARVLRDELNVSTRWIEDQSNTTQENAQFSARLLREHQIDTIYLVTHVWHMPRARRVFEKEKFQVIAVPTGYQHKDVLTPLDYFPSSDGFKHTRQYWHEVLGLLWYRMLY